MKALFDRAVAHPLLLMVAMVLLALASACAQLGVPAPKNFGEQVAVAIATVTEVRSTAGTLLSAKKISPDDAQKVQDQADIARSAIDAARSMRSTDPAGAQTKLDGTITILQGLKAALARKGA